VGKEDSLTVPIGKVVEIRTSKEIVETEGNSKTGGIVVTAAIEETETIIGVIEVTVGTGGTERIVSTRVSMLMLNQLLRFKRKKNSFVSKGECRHIPACKVIYAPFRRVITHLLFNLCNS
jgi:hypothetical protein